MARKTPEKTNAMRHLNALSLPYWEHYFESDGALSGVEVAALLGQDPERVFKTLVTAGRSGAHYVFMIPAPAELDLRKAARAVGEKSVEMVRSKELLPLTGYIHGGCSPIGMKKFFTTTVHETAILYDTIFFSGGRIGCQIEMRLEDLARAIPLTTADLII